MWVWVAEEQPLPSFPTLRLCPLTNGTLVHVLVASSTCETRWTGADGPAIHWVSVTDSILVTGVASVVLPSPILPTLDHNQRGQALGCSSPFTGDTEARESQR